MDSIKLYAKNELGQNGLSVGRSTWGFDSWVGCEWVLDLEWKPLYIVKSFRLFTSAASISLFGQLTIPAEYLDDWQGLWVDVMGHVLPFELVL